MVSTDFDRARDNMVRTQIEERGVFQRSVLEAMRSVPRHCFVPAESASAAYEDHPLPIGYGQTISQPYMVALMTQVAEIAKTDRVLEVGTGSGYQAAILSLLAKEVVTIERNLALAEAARERLSDLGYANVTVIRGDGTLGCPERGPYDVILVTAAGPNVPNSLKNQLKVRGRLVCPVGGRNVQSLVKISRVGDGFIQEQGISCVFVPLVGAEGWTEQ